MAIWLASAAHPAGTASPAFLAVLGVAALGAAALLGLALAAFVRRQSRPYLLIVGAFVALLGRSAVAALTVFGTVSTRTHHVLEHGLDVVLVALVVAAVYYARSKTPEVDPNP